MSKQFLYFIITSAIAAGVNILTRMGLSVFISYDWAIVFAYMCGMITAYVLAKIFVFEDSGKTVRAEMTGFVIVNFIAIIQVWGVSVLLVRLMFPIIDYYFYPELTAHIIGVVSPAFTSYFGHKYISFSKS